MATASNVQLVISAKDEASKVLKGVGTSLSAIGTVAKVGAAAVGVAGAAIVAFGISSVKAANAAEVEMAKFNATLATMGKKGEEAKGKLLEMADAAVQFGFDDEDAANSLAKFFKITGDVTKAQTDNNLAMDIARQKGISLGDASRVVALGLAGNVRALKEYGIEIKKGTDSTQVLSEMQKIFGGQAQAFADTTAGKQEIFNQKWENTKEAFGDALKEIIPLNAAMDYLNNILTPENVQRFTSEIAKIPQIFQDIRNQVMGWFSETNVAWNFLVTLFGPSFEIIRVAAVNAFTEIKKALEPIMPVLEMFLKILGITLIAALAVIARVFAETFKIVAGIISGVVTVTAGTISLMTKAFTAFFGWFPKATTSAVEGFKNAFSSVAGFVNGIWDSIVAGFKSAINGALSGINKVIGGVNKIPGVDIPKIKGLQFGGGVTAGTSYLVGEHRPEVFVPTQSGNIKQTSQVSGSKVITVNFNNASVRNDQDLSDIVSMVKKTLAREQELIQMGA